MTSTEARRSGPTSLGRSAPILGDLRTADATILLATLCDEYDDQHTSAELAGWIEAAGGWDTARPALTDALKRVRLHARRNGLLRMLVAELPDGHGPDLLRCLRTDLELAPSALFVGQEQAAEAALLAEKTAEHGPDDMNDREYALAVTEGLLLMLGQDGAVGGRDGGVPEDLFEDVDLALLTAVGIGDQKTGGERGNLDGLGPPSEPGPAGSGHRRSTSCGGQPGASHGPPTVPGTTRTPSPRTW